MELTRELVFMGNVSRALARGDMLSAFDLLAGRYPRHLALRILDEFVALEPIREVAARPEEPEPRPPEGSAELRTLVRTQACVVWKQSSPLSRRELEVLRWVAEGDDNGHIAARLHVSIETVKSHMRHALEKVGARTRAQAVALAFKQGLLGFSDPGPGQKGRT